MNADPWSEDDVFWAAFAPFLFSEDRIARARGEIDELLSLVELDEGAHILDQAIGVGRHAAELSRRGYVVAGIDRTRLYLEQARTTAPNVEVIEADMREFARESAFDLVTNLWTSFGFFDEEENLRVAENALRSLKPGGCYVLEMMGKEVFASSMVLNRHMWLHDQTGPLFLEDTVVDPGYARTRSTWTIIDEEGKRFSREITIRIYSGVELQQLLWSAGFDEVELYGSLEGTPYDTDAERLVAVARRAA